MAVKPTFTKTQELYLKVERFWDNLPKAVKIAVYGLFSTLLTRLADDLIAGVEFDYNVYIGIVSTYGANIVIAVVKDFKDKITNLEKKQEEYNRMLLGR